MVGESVSENAIAQGIVPSLGHLRTTFLTLHIAGGLVGLPLLILTLLFSERVPRQPALINFCIAWVINSISYTLSGLSPDPLNPPSSLCFAQAAMVHGAPPMAAFATFIVVFKIWQTFRDPHGIWLGRSWTDTQTLFITIILPYIVFFIFFVISVVLQDRNPEAVSPGNGLYCTVYAPFRGWSVPMFSIMMLALMIGFEVAIGVHYYRSHKRIVTNFPLAPRTTSLGLVIRITLFNMYLFITFCASIVFLTGKRNQSWLFMVQAALPLVAFLVFASQKNVILSWCFWIDTRKEHPSTSDTSMPTLRHTPSDTHIDHLSSLASRRFKDYRGE
ncbi:unnamed protein product [Cyclocybe aegerita]|uniref:Uncharacterized protein n=1 Tax=Cyclocybe aegerita TaxID=1973307 RepID=A0A8S0WDI5_CYCAE|nr:unnamed protein product [Cyclocybe aegerita]